MNSRLQDLTNLLGKLPSLVLAVSGLVAAVFLVVSYVQQNFDLAVPTLAIILWLVCVYVATKRVKAPLVVAGDVPKDVYAYPRWRPIALCGVVLIPFFVIIGGGIRIGMVINASRLENPCLPQNKPSAPRLESFQVQRISQAPIPVTPGSTIQLSAGESVGLEARVVGTGKMSCTWKVTRGRISPNDECATKYSFPIGAMQAIVTVTVKSECKESTNGYLIFVTK